MLGRIYKITNLINNKIYIGQTIQSLKDRWYRHVGNSKWLSQYEQDMAIKRAIRKYGKDSFKIELIEECDRSELDEKEKYYIELFDSYNTGYNSTKGGQGGFRSFKVQNDEDIHSIIEMYKSNKTLKEIGAKFHIDKATVKSILLRNNIQIRSRRIRKFSQEDIDNIKRDLLLNVSRKEIISKYKISKAYLSQLSTGARI